LELFSKRIQEIRFKIVTHLYEDLGKNYVWKVNKNGYLAEGSVTVNGNRSQRRRNNTKLFVVDMNVGEQIPANVIQTQCVSHYYGRKATAEKGKAVPVTDRGGPYGCETSRLPYFLDNRLSDGGEVVSLTRQPPFTPRKIPGTHFC
jgi:hypothetical protein